MNFNPSLQAQDCRLVGKIIDESKKPLTGANIYIKGTTTGTTTNESGEYNLKLPCNQWANIVFTYFEKTLEKRIFIAPNQIINLDIRFNTNELEGVEIISESDSLKRGEVSLVRIDPKRIERMPSAFGDFNKILATFAGVVSNNELSSTYSVRGGNFDENLVYVNDIQIYRPFLVRAGQQEGLSFINPNLVGDIKFSSGGWQPKYGDKLSSVLDVTYKKPTENLAGSVTLGILNNSAHIEGRSNNEKISFVLGFRRKSSQYLLNTLPVKGQYLPQFTDYQGYLTYKATPKTTLGFLFSYARNRYFVQPTTRESNFGTFRKALKLLVAFEGQETLSYDLFQNALKITHKPNSKLTLNFITSIMNTTEREYSEVEGGYKLYEINPNASRNNNQNTIIGIGTNYESRRNNLKALILALENRSEYKINNKHQIEFGARFSQESFEDVLNEYSFTDSADYATIQERSKKNNYLNTRRLATYIQHKWQLDSIQTITYGLRFGYWDLNKEVLLSPTFQYAIRPRWRGDWVLKASMGVYQQPAFYRELRDFQGNLNQNLKSQKSLHTIIGADYLFESFGRPFRLQTELYYKYLWDVTAYDVDNVRLRYYANNDAKAYAVGFDTRISGEFIKGTESWFSVSLLQTKEDVGFDNKGYIRRPTDQRLTFGFYLEDHLPNDPTWRMNLNLVWGTGLPFGIPKQPNQRDAFQGGAYRRVDIGFSKFINNIRFKEKTLLKSLWIGLEVLNLIGVENVISYTWIQDVNRNSYAIPNSLSQRFFNLRLIGKF
jgi:hypothetical protein